MNIDEVFHHNKPLMTPRELEVHMAREDGIAAFWKRLGSSMLRSRVPAMTPMGEVVPIFCLNCGTPQGGVTKDAADHGVVFICRSCAATHGGLPVPDIPEDLVRPQPTGKE